MISTLGVTSKILLYLGVHLTNSSANTVILYVGVNDLMEGNSQSKIENLGENLKTMIEKCHTYGIKSKFRFGLHSKNRSTSY